MNLTDMLDEQDRAREETATRFTREHADNHDKAEDDEFERQTE